MSIASGSISEVSLNLDLTAESETPMPLSLPEVLNHIFSFNTRDSNFNCALVCKSWKELALDHVWAELSGPKPLALLLAPLVEGDSVVEGRPSLVFQRDISPRDWERAKPYMRRVKVFGMCRAKDNKIAMPHGMISPTAFAEIARTRPMSDIFPNLTRLVVYVEDRFVYWMRYAVLFLREGLKDMTMSFRPQTLTGPFTQLVVLFEEIVSRSPRLTSFRMLTKNAPVAAYDANLFHFLPLLRELETFEFSSLALTTVVLRCLSSLPSLKCIAGVSIKTRKRGERPDLELFVFKGLALGKENFAELRRFAIQGEPADLSVFFNNPQHDCFPSLTALNIDVLDIEHSLHLKQLLLSLSLSCPNLELLQLTRRELSNAFIPEGTTITADVFEALPNIKNLEKFECSCFGNIRIMDDELTDILSRCPTLQRVYIGYEPNAALCSTTLTLKCLLSLSEQCPQLKAIGLHIDTSPQELPSPSEVFYELLALRVALSAVANKFQVAMFLNQLLSSPQILKTNTETLDGVDILEESAVADVRQRKKDWDEVKQIMIDLDRMRERDRATIAALQEENASLKAQLSIAFSSVSVLDAGHNQSITTELMDVSDDDDSS